jgi:NADPH:quinone reductase-like Zn-dependent oxidoreductase
VVFEHVGAATFEESVRSAAYGGRIVTCGATTGHRAALDLRFVFAKQLAIQGVTLGARADLERVLELVAEGRLAPVVDRVLALEECRLAHELLERGEPFGKLVLRVGAP